MMSRRAFEIASLLATGAFTLHDLRASLVTVEGVAEAEVDKYLKEGLLDLAANGWITWEYEHDYGNAASERPEEQDAANFLKHWGFCVQRGGLSQVVPDAKNPTLLIEATDMLLEEMQKPEYKRWA